METQVPKIDIDEFIQQLKGMVGGANVLHHPDDLLVFEYDGSIDRGMPKSWSFLAPPRKSKR